jgi:predicted DNA-binding protein (UPF0278 family)
MDINNTIKKIASEQGIFITERDPLLTAILLNRLILEEYVEKINEKIDNGISDFEIKERETFKKMDEALKKQQSSFSEENNRLLAGFASEIKNHQLKSQPLQDSKESHLSILIWLMMTFAVGMLVGGLIIRHYL